jgi:DNA-binding MarR family transcriptional regulator
MPRQARLDGPGVLHHIIVRGIEGCRIFRDEQDREDFVIGEEGERGGSELRARVCYHLNHELGIPMAEIARHVGVCASAVVKSIQKMESGG